MTDANANANSNSNSSANPNSNTPIPKMSRYIALPTTYSFIILCNQRSGSHLLMAFLDSHPQITCYGEYRYPDDLHHKLINDSPSSSDSPTTPTKPIIGCILMYNHVYERPHYLTDLKWSKCIHLTRDYEATAISALRSLHEDRVLRKDNKRFKFHQHLDGPATTFQTEYYPNVHEIEKYIKQIKSREKSCLDLIEKYNRPILHVTYEELTKGEDVRTIPDPAKIKLCEFLGVEHEGIDLTTYIIRGAR